MKPFTVCAPESSSTVWVPPTVKLGASLTAVTLMVTLSASVSAPPLPVLPLSLVVMLSASAPLKFRLP